MKKCFSILGVIVFVTMICGTFSTVCWAKDYPAKSIYCIVPWSAGGGTDTTVRGFLKVAEKFVGTDFNVSNVTGGGGSVGWAALASAKSDGYTIGALTYDILTHSAKEKPPFSYEDFNCLIGISQYPLVLIVKADAPWDTMDQLMNHSKANKGKLKAGIGAMGGSQHQLLNTLENRLDVKFRPVPFKGGANIIAAVLGDNVEMGLITSPEAKNRPDIKVLAQFSASRHEDLPKVPTASELGLEIVHGSFRGLGAPKGTPNDKIKFLRDKFTDAWHGKDFQDWAKKAGASASYMSGEDFQKMLKAMFPNVKQALQQLTK
jgi:tripartite-type tricarboxylate transporter receptor subunit TctC